jgi:hypothetical protein
MDSEADRFLRSYPYEMATRLIVRISAVKLKARGLLKCWGCSPFSNRRLHGSEAWFRLEHHCGILRGTEGR